MINALVNTIAASTANAIGDLSNGPDAVLNSLGNKLAHFMAGCALGAANAGNSSGCAAGAIGAAVGEMMAEAMGSGTNGLPSGWTDQNTVYLSGLFGGLGMALAGGDQEQITTANWAGSNAAANNRLAHYDEREKIRLAADGDQELEGRLNRAACFAIKCWAQFPEGSDLYKANYVGALEAGSLGPELAWVESQKKYGYFKYTSFDKITDKIAGTTGLASGTLDGRSIGVTDSSINRCQTYACMDAVAGIPQGAASLPDGMYTIGLSGAAPLLGSIRIGLGVSLANDGRQYGFAIDSPVLGVGVDKLFLNRWGVDLTYQTGSFASNNGSMDQVFRGGWGLWGGGVSREPIGMNGASINFGPQFGVEVGAQQTRTWFFDGRKKN